MLQQSDFKINLAGFSVNDRFIQGSDQFKVGFIDTGTTFAYFPSQLIDKIRSEF